MTVEAATGQLMRLMHAELEGSHHFAPEAIEMADVFGPEDSNSHVNKDTSQVTDREAAFPSLHPSKDLCSHAERQYAAVVLDTIKDNYIQ